MDDLDSIELQFLEIVRPRRQIVGDEGYMVASAANGADHFHHPKRTAISIGRGQPMIDYQDLASRSHFNIAGIDVEIRVMWRSRRDVDRGVRSSVAGISSG